MSKLPRPFEAWTTYDGHGGIDYPEPLGSGIRASGPGTVDFSGWYSDRGGYAKFISYDNGIRCGYYHLRDLVGLGVGQRVAEGTTFAYVGSSGYSTGPHLHHEVWINGELIPQPRYWDHIDQERYVGGGSTTGTTEGTEGYPDMFIANVKGSFYLIVPQGSQKPTGVILGKDSGARDSGIPILTFTGDMEIKDLKSAVTGIS